MSHQEDMTPREIAVVLDVSINYVYLLLRAERLRAAKLDGQWMIPKAEVIAWFHHVKGEDAELPPALKDRA